MSTPTEGPAAEPSTGPEGDHGEDLRVTGRVLDPPALRALAHPLRFQLVELLIERGPATASELGRLVDESSGLTSYHLRELAKHGLIEEAPELGTARDRYWRAVSGGYTLEGFEMLQREDTRADARFLLDEVLRTRFERLRRWHDDAVHWGEAWVGVSSEMTARLQLTREELGELTNELLAVVDRYRDGGSRQEEGEPGRVPVVIQIDSFPTGDPPERDDA